MSQQPTLYYFNGRGFGELPRLILNFAGVQFTDVRVEDIDDALRARLPFGQIPFFEDGKIELSQSRSIVRFLSSKYKIAGKDENEIALVDAVAESIWDVVNPYFIVKDDAEKLLKYKTETIPRFFANWESLLLKNGGKHFVGQSLTYADISIFHALDYLKFVGLDQLDSTKYPTLQSLYKSVSEIPSLKLYLENRPTDSKF
ncbi:putative glutathione S-transferase [Cavenderia fasciculata]|uniref:Glutathione S-transferase n=1 Tax=Cavenderia fasciculata TaxID=261658 RepID=F4PQ08_CACFS|nr:putative glutathione S-transferase [Cavenderia fasciculata]EGG22471.1 putative glutathione S-transferase [Cavenderia fasciculata]|eukprot:XP_004360322.1 putative glutathione S-transferase [Cavenderia fasciculata]